ncbi:MAG: class I SAM-dependent DNA methyltransferase [Candidatus Hodarchaeota archaeon]
MYDEFKDLAAYYDELYVKSDQYQREVVQIDRFVSTYKQNEGNKLLDIACGTGGHLTYLQDRYQVAGLDLSQDMLLIARKKFPTIPFYLENMINFSLDQHFDIIICMYGSIGFVKTFVNLKQTMNTIVNHLNPGGIIIIVPWSTTETFQERIVTDVVNLPHIRIARMENVKQKTTNLVEVTIHHLIDQNRQVKHHTQTVEVGLFSQKEYTSAFQEAKIQLVEFYQGREISMSAFVGRLPK